MRLFLVVVGFVVCVGCDRAPASPVSAPDAPTPRRVDDAAVARRPSANQGGPTDRAHELAGPPETELTQTSAVEIQHACVGAFSSRARAAQRLYDQWVDMARGPSCHERHIAMHTLGGDVAACREAVTAAPSSAIELSTAGDAYADAVEDLEPLLEDADRYYRSENYRLDACAHGQALHPQLVHGFEALFAADATLEALGTEIEDRAMDARLAALAADLVHRPEYLAEVVLDRARRLILLTQGLRIVRWHLVADDAVVFRAAIDALRAAVDELATGSLDGIDPSVGYRSAASTFLSAARAMAQRLDGEAFNERERHALGRGEVFGSPDRAVAAYNHLVDAYNHRLRR